MIVMFVLVVCVWCYWSDRARIAEEELRKRRGKRDTDEKAG